MSIGVRFPFQESPQGGIFASTKTTADAIRSNLVSLLTTKRGHRVMNNRLFSPLYDYIFEQFDSRAEADLDRDLRDKISEFMPMVSVDNIEYNFEEEINALTTKIIYKLPSLGNMRDQVSLTINIDDAQWDKFK